MQLTDYTVREAVEMQKKFPEYRIALITPDPEEDAAAMVKRQGKLPIAVGVDRSSGDTAAYMGRSILMPQAFIIDRDAVILWRGEAFDLGPALSKAAAGKLDASSEAKVFKELEKLEGSVRSRNEREQKRIIKEIFDLDPTNQAAVRMYLFCLENTGRNDMILPFLKERIADAPDAAEIYFIAADQTASGNIAVADFLEMLKKFKKNIPVQSSYRLVMASMLIERAGYSSELLAAADELIPAQGDSAEYYETRALLLLKLGAAEKALADCRKAVEIASQHNKSDLKRLEEFAGFLQNLIKTAEKR
jgi:tetratricopeptide (TPR) repeat protein